MGSLDHIDGSSSIMADLSAVFAATIAIVWMRENTSFEACHGC